MTELEFLRESRARIDRRIVELENPEGPIDWPIGTRVRDWDDEEGEIIGYPEDGARITVQLDRWKKRGLVRATITTVIPRTWVAKVNRFSRGSYELS